MMDSEDYAFFRPSLTSYNHDQLYRRLLSIFRSKYSAPIDPRTIIIAGVYTAYTAPRVLMFARGRRPHTRWDSVVSLTESGCFGDVEGGASSAEIVITS